MVSSLRQLCLDEGHRYTDKNRGARDHLSLYEQLFTPYRLSATKVFEIGVNRGGSIRMWRNYFSTATVYGLDILKEVTDEVGGDRIVGIQLDQSDRKQLEAFGNEHGPFDIGIDDGSHVWSHQISTFETLWPRIKPGGMYIVEDVLTSYPAWLERSSLTARTNYTEGGVSAVTYFKRLIDEINFNGDDNAAPSDYTEYQRTIDWIAFRCNSVFIRKRDDA